MPKYLIGLDCGSTVVKAAMFDAAGKEIAVSARKVEHIYLHPGWTENNMDTLRQNAFDVIAEVLRNSQVDPGDVACVSCAGHGNGLYLVDADGKPARNGIISSDGRAREYIETWTRENVLERILPKTMQSLWPAQPNALLRWLMDNEPETIQKTKWMFMCKDYIRFALTGEAYMELTDMSGTSLINVGTAAYDDEVLETWGLSSLRGIMPPLKRSADICGGITAEAAKTTGLREGTPVAGGLFDIDACGLAVGMVNETQLCMIAGTWGNNQYVSKTPVIDPDTFMTSCYGIDGYYLMLEGSATSASNLEWLVTHFFEGDRELLQLRGETKSIYSYCNDLIASTKPGDTGIIFVPYLYGSPVSLDGKSCFFGLDGRHTRGHVMRAVFEGIVFGHRWHVERLLRFRGKPQTLRLTGGAVNSDLWAQMFADIFQVPVEIPAGTELGCFGAAVCGAVAAGIYDSFDAACNEMVKIDRAYQPNPDLEEIYQRKYQRYLKLLETFAPVWSELAW